ncbi:hypothetical protein BURMUCF2_2560 [Burkholderia multivorans CF2]|nr:hypothetical protein BURMUCF2_2560 [Burkholderia multivorans CF2]
MWHAKKMRGVRMARRKKARPEPDELSYSATNAALISSSR